IKCGTTTVKLPAMNAEEFPRKAHEYMKMSEVQGESLETLTNNTKFAVSDNEQTPTLTGVHIHQEDGLITATATNRHRLARKSIEFKGTAEGQYIIPVRLLDATSKIKPAIV